MAEARDPTEETRRPARERSQFPRLERSVNACQRRRGRKQKAPYARETCSTQNAQAAFVLGLDALYSIPAKEVAALRTENENLRREQQIPSPSGGTFSATAQHSISTGTSSDPPSEPNNDTDLVVSMARVALGSTNEPRFMGTSSGITLAKLVMAAIEMPLTPSSIDKLGELEKRVDSTLFITTAPASLLSRRVTDRLVEIYFEYRSPYFTFMSRQDVRESLEHVYRLELGNRSTIQLKNDRHMFVVYMIMAIGLSSGPEVHKSSTKQSEGYFNSALKHVDAVFAYSNLWHIAGVALRLCIDLGLHWEGSSIVRENPHFVDARRRLWWTTYKLDRLLCITLGRPFGIVDQSISVALPLVTVDESQINSITGEFHSICPQKRVSNHLTRIYQLESEIKHVLYHQFKSSSLAFVRPNYELWFPDISKRLEQWYEDIPCTRLTERQAGYQTYSWWMAFYDNALLLLHRPSPIIPQPTTTSLRICLKAAHDQIFSIREIYRDNNIDMVWIWVHRLFLAGITSTYCLWQSPQVRQEIRFDDLIETTQACSSVLSALAERFSGAEGCRDSYDKLSVATMEYFANAHGNAQYQFLGHPASHHYTGTISQDITGNLAGEIHITHSQEGNPQFDDPNLQVNPSYLQNFDGFPRDCLLPLRGMQFGEMFPFDDMELGQTLNSAAQWPANTDLNYFPE
ncbi:hypothetical protein SBOR_3424 [Sclerotinia borealis F-4128]|uniref:Xylanolytic transcriptional activator regulatory domain-containing protein n=1 Tax=Sclerotinia borealis (strain F-4128) TaxID=1432307 RepID=W9CNB4_SCLBF|nr:hypothetical protein SBOR_3424 [Sclerotinia borealis F-4128]